MFNVEHIIISFIISARVHSQVILYILKKLLYKYEVLYLRIDRLIIIAL